MLASVVIAALPGACNECPPGTEFRTLWVTTLPVACELTVVREGGNVSYSTMCGAPAFRSVNVCVVKPPEKPEPAQR
jgi:hypothetical protein